MAIGKANSAVQLRGATNAKYVAICNSSTMDASMIERSA